MLKKIGLGTVVLLLAAIGFAWVKWLLPIQITLDKFWTGLQQPRDYALQDDSRVTRPANTSRYLSRRAQS